MILFSQPTTTNSPLAIYKVYKWSRWGTDWNIRQQTKAQSPHSSYYQAGSGVTFHLKLPFSTNRATFGVNVV
jgi:hypothetical protein